MKLRTSILVVIFSSLFVYGQQSRIDSLKNEIKREKADTTLINLNIHLSDAFKSFEKDSSLFYFNRALKIASKISGSYNLGDRLYDRGLDFEAERKFESAIESYKKAVLVFQTVHDSITISTLYNFIGANYVELYADDKAIDFFIKSLRICEKLDDQFCKAISFTDIGNLYYDQKRYGDAKQYFQDALDIFINLDDPEGISSSYTNLGNAFSDNKEYDEGINYFNKSIAIQESENDQLGVAINYNNMADSYIQLNQLDMAYNYFTQALKIAEELNDEDLIALVYLNIADIYLIKNNYSKAVTFASRSLVLSNKIGNTEYQLDNLLFLAKSYEGLDSRAKALQFYKKHYQLKDSINKLDKANIVELFNTLNELDESHYTISELSAKNKISELKHENERKTILFLIITIGIFVGLTVLLIRQRSSKKRAYNLLKKKNFQINKMNDEILEQSKSLSKINKTKDSFFSIIAHDLKNPFNSIKGFSELLIENIDEYDKEKQLKFLKIINDSSSKTSILLNNLLEWANSQSGKLVNNPQKTELVNDVLDVISLLEIQAVKKEIDIYNNIDHNLMVFVDKNMLDTILRNLLSNAIKFTKPHGEIKIRSKRKEKMVEITVKDNGVGILEADIKSLFSIDKNTHIGTSNEQGSGLGLVLCKDFVEKNGGEIWVESELDKGTEFTFSIPLWEDNIDYF